MKKIIILSSFLFISAFSFGQSVTLTPNSNEAVVTNYANTPEFIGRRSSGSSASPFATFPNVDLVYFGGAGYNGTTFTSNRASIKFRTTQQWTNTANGTQIVFSNTPNNSTILTDRMVINHDGKVGIGTTSPNYKLQIHESTVGSSTSLLLTNADAGSNLTDGLRINLNPIQGIFDFAATITNQENAGLYFGTNNINRMAIDEIGNVGIGTITPSDKLHVSNGGTGEVYLKASAVTSGLSGLRLQNVGGDWQLFTNEFNRMFLDYSADNYTTRTGVLIFEPNGANFNMIPTTTNNVFLGTSANRWREIWSQNALNTSSDRRLKKNIVEIKYGLEDVLKLNAVTYNWKNGSDSKLHLGFIAQEVDKIIPEIVSKSGLSDEEYARLEKEGKPINDTYGMEYTGLIPVLVKAVQEQQRIIEGKSQKISQLEEKLQKMEGLEARLSLIEASINSSKTKQEVKADK